ncbi:MAG TPA: hypothetical protein VF278_06970 [Pirellulales bacterium]
MHIADIMVALIVIGMLVVLLACFVAAFGVMRGLWADYRGLLARARVNPRFGMGTIFKIMTIAAIASAFFRRTADYDHPVLTTILACAAIVFAIGMVCGVQFVLAEFRENWSRRRAARSQCEMVWQEPVCSETDQGEGRRDVERAS